jgi:SAM-dependent methyltransferase
VVGTVIRRDEAELLEGALVCPEPSCQREYPIIDGIPIILAAIRDHLGHQLAELRARDDLSPFTESLLGDCGGPGSDFDRARYQLSSYGRDHYGDLDPDEPAPAAGGLVPLLETAAAMLAAPPRGLWLDAGCSVGRSTFELAARTGELVLGVDVNFAMLRTARRVAREGRVRHPLRRVGMVYDRRDFAVDLAGRDAVDFWSCDATALPFEAATFDGLLSLNLLDCVSWPLSHLIEIGRVLRPGAEAVIATPYDWSVNATPIEGWLGGHSQRNQTHGSSVAELRRLLGPGAPAGAPRLALAAERERLPWRVYVHERATMIYDVHLMVAAATGPDVQRG